MENWMISWGLAILVTAGLTVYYTAGSRPKVQVRQAAEAAQQTLASAAAKKKQPKSALRKETPPATTAAVSSAKASADTKNRKSHQKTSSVSFTPDVAEANQEDDVAQEDKEWARQLDAAKKGINLNASKQSAKPAKQTKKKQAAAGQSEPANGFPAAAGGVSDMLEPVASGPSSIRITGEEKPKQPQTVQAAPEKETKKQRQNRRKVEEAKAQREADEQQRKKLEEQQRRSAREARGEPAKNGLGSASAPASNAWNGSSQPKANSGTPAPAVAPLLDTFEPTQAVFNGDSSVNGAAPSVQASTLNPSDMSEEQQVEYAQQLSGWNEVSTKKGKKKTANDSPPPEAAMPTAAAPAAAPAPAKEANKFSAVSTSELVGGKKSTASTNAYAALEEATRLSSSAKGHPQDSDWAAN